MKSENPDWPVDVEHRLLRIERMAPCLFRICAILADIQVMAFLIAVGVLCNWFC